MGGGINYTTKTKPESECVNYKQRRMFAGNYLILWGTENHKLNCVHHITTNICLFTVVLIAIASYWIMSVLMLYAFLRARSRSAKFIRLIGLIIPPLLNHRHQRQELIQVVCGALFSLNVFLYLKL